MGCFSPDFPGLESPKITPHPGHARNDTVQPSTYLLRTIPRETLCPLALHNSLESWGHGVAKWNWPKSPTLWDNWVPRHPIGYLEGEAQACRPPFCTLSNICPVVHGKRGGGTVQVDMHNMYEVWIGTSAPQSKKM